MLRSLVIIAFGALLASSAMADSSVIGRGELLIQSDAHGSTATDYREQADGKIVGEGSGLPGSNSMISLQRQAGGVQGIVFGRFLNIVCDANTCTDKGATEMNIKVSTKSGAIQLEGTLNYNFINVTYSANSISISTNRASYQMDRQSNGTLSGGGAFSTLALNPTFEATLTASGSLANLAQDPAMILAVLVSPFCGENL